MIGSAYRIVAARVVRHEVVNLGGHLWGPVFERVRTPEGFAEAYVDGETGTITWPGEVDLAPDTLYIRVKTGEWPTGLSEEPKGV